MNPESDTSSPQLELFEQWLAQRPVKARPDLAACIRRQIDQEEGRLEQKIDSLFAKDLSLHDPELAARIRRRIKEETDDGKVVWYQWLTPLAAALVLGIAFFSFQTRAPLSESAASAHSPIAISTPAAPVDSPEITRIFALASNLQGTSDMSRLQSVDDLAFLFE